MIFIHRNFYIIIVQNVIAQTGCRVHPASYSVGIREPFRGGKAAGLEADFSP
jgi:hypothetical protein